MVSTETIVFFFFQAEDGIRVLIVTGVQTCALPICGPLVVLDVLVQSRRDKRAAKRLLRKLLKRQMRPPRIMVTELLWLQSKAAQIGRASCREREKSTVVDVAENKKDKQQKVNKTRR